MCALCPRGAQTLQVREYARNDYIPYGASAISTMASVFEQHGFRAHRLQLSRNLRDSPGFIASVPDHGRPCHCSIVCPGCWPCLMLCMVGTGKTRNAETRNEKRGNAETRKQRNELVMVINGTST